MRENRRMLLKVENLLNGIKIETRIDEDNFRNFDDVFKELVDKWDDTTDEFKKKLVDSIFTQ